jgi:hypothetical protein
MAWTKAVLLLVPIVIVACAQPSLTDAVVANTGTARSSDGYEASVAAAEAGGYSIIINDQKHAFVRVQSRTSLGSDPSQRVYLDLKAWKGAVDVNVTVPRGFKLDEVRLGRVLGERRELAWAVATRARLIAGEPLSGSGVGLDGNAYYPTWGKTMSSGSSTTLP